MQLSAYDYHVFHLLFDPEKDHVLKTEYDCIRKLIYVYKCLL